MQYKAVLFDHDGTLADSEVVHYQFWADVLAELGVAFPEAHYRTHYTGVSELATAQHLRQTFALSPSVDSLVQAKRERAKAYHAHKHYPTLPFVEATLETLKTNGVRMAVVSGSARFALEANLEAAGLRHYFEFIASGEEVAENKPAPDVYQHALAQLQLPVADCLAVEDTCSGLTAAKAAGLVTCVIPNRFSGHQDFTAADQRFAHMGEFCQWLLNRPL
ncbi:HAD family hydrolase [Simiduia agarivorans]|uniref:HAD-superfamily hydrolase n=1 Tax=Simiduia agarivorans (strain DSM 21679 / JCM 13881 / BCRC 17597 / SA1) TaxID=1117647 RepID=K4KG82_SIMAS|nr:HAD family phosphatase [Simiduia agarivorans]AFU97981.1 HAD-superfamily hydrolase [Simiduia agarivorans SA1 = DSM 21679]